MNWITSIAILATLILMVINVQPLWIQFVALAISASLFLVQVVQTIQVSGRTRAWAMKYRLLLIGIPGLLVLNAVARRYDQVWDFSQTKVYSLSPESVTWIQKIQDPVQVLIFLRKDDKTFAYANWIQKQMDQHSPHVTVEIKNINKEVQLTQFYQVGQTGETVLVSGSRWVKVKNFKEEYLIPGFVKLLSKVQSPLCYVTGHGEPDPESTTEDGTSKLKTLLADYGYQVKVVSLLNFQEVPSHANACSVIMVLSPKLDVLDQEVDALKRMLGTSTTFLWGLDPPTSPALVRLFEDWGLRFSGDWIVNPQNLDQHLPLTNLFVPSIGTHPVLNGLQSQIYLPDSQAFSVVSDKTSWKPVLVTPANMPFQLLRGTQDKTAPGFFTLIASSTDSTGQPKQWVAGTGKGFTNKYLNFGDNELLVLNSLRWLLKEDGSEWSLPLPKEETHWVLSARERTLVQIVFLYVFPGVAFLVFLWLFVIHHRRWKHG
jgi:hypothetical protein